MTSNECLTALLYPIFDVSFASYLKSMTIAPKNTILNLPKLNKERTEQFGNIFGTIVACSEQLSRLWW
jgi:hypothetical protein